MKRSARRARKGFTLIELLIVIAIIGIIAVLLIPNFIDALQKAKQKRTVSSQKLVGTALLSWLTDESSAAAAGQLTGVWTLSNYTGSTDVAAIEAVLSPRYIQGLPRQDGWKNESYYNLDIANPASEWAMAIGSGGRNGLATGWQPEASYQFGAFAPSDYDQDIIWSDGFFIRWPDKLT